MQNSKERTRLSYFSSVIFLLVMTLGYAIYSADRYVLSAMLSPLTSALALSEIQIGLLSSAQYIGVLCVVFLAGHLSDKYGRLRVLITGVAVFTVFTWLIGLAGNFYEAFSFRLISGLGEGIFWPVAMAAVAAHFKRRKGLALGIFYVGFDVGSVAGLSIGGVVYALTSSWRPAFFVAPSLGLLVIAGAFALRKRLVASKAESSSRLRLGWDALDLLRQRNVLVLMIFAFLATWAGVWLVVFLPFYYNKVLHLTIYYSALLASLVAISGGFGKVALGGLSDYLKRNRLLVTISVIVVFSYAIFFSTTSLLVTLLAAVAVGFFNSGIFPITQALMVDSCGEDKAGTALGLTTSAQSVATVIAPILTASLFSLGVGRAIAIDAMAPAIFMIMAALFLKESRAKLRIHL